MSNEYIVNGVKNMQLANDFGSSLFEMFKGGKLRDVVVAYETCSKEASAQSRLMEDYLCHMIINGTLHLLGHDHDNEEEAIIMENFERKSLTPLGITDPYINISK